MRLGIVITSYNSEKTLENTINSLLKFKKFKDNIYIVLIDDNSNDSTTDIANKALREKLIDHIHYNKKRRGVSYSRNVGIKLCKDTDYLTFLDGDDEINTEFFDVLIREKNIYDLIIFNYSLTDQNKKIIKNNFGNSRDLQNQEIKKYFYEYLLQPNNKNLFNHCWAKIYKTKNFIKSKKNFFNIKLYICEDTDFVFRYLLKYKKIKYINFNMYTHHLTYKNQNLKTKATFGINRQLINQVSFLHPVKSVKKYLFRDKNNLINIRKKINHCIGAYTIIYTIRSCLRIISIKELFNNYLFWKKIYNRKIFSNAISDYNYVEAGARANKLLPILIRNKFYFIAILYAYILCKKRY